MKKLITLLLTLCLFTSAALLSGCNSREEKVEFPGTFWENKDYGIAFFKDGYAEVRIGSEIYLGTYTADDDGAANIMLANTRLSCWQENGKLRMPGFGSDDDILLKRGKFKNEPQCEHKPRSDDPLMNTSWFNGEIKYSFLFGGILEAEDLHTGKITEGFYFWYGDGTGYASVGDETMMLAFADGILSMSVDNENYSELTPDGGKTPVTPSETDKPDESTVSNDSFLAPPDMEDFDQDEKLKNPDGTYYYTYYNDERMIDLIDTAFFMPNEENEQVDEFVLRAVTETVETDIHDFSASEGESLYTCYFLSWQTGGNEDTRQAKGLMVIDGDIVYLAYFELPGDFYEDNEADIAMWLNDFTLIFFPEE